MASIVGAAVIGYIAGGDVSGMVAWPTGGDHDQYGKGAKVLYVKPTMYINLDHLDYKVYKDESSSFIHLLKLQWTSELIIAVICAGLLVHLLSGLWGWLGRRKHEREAATKEHEVAVAKLKEEMRERRATTSPRALGMRS